MAKKDVSKLLWAPWILAVAYVVLLVVVSLDTLKGSGDVQEKLAALLPAIVTLALLIVSRKKTALLGVFFLVFAVAFAAYLIGTATGAADAFTIMCGIPGVIGVLFILLTKNSAAKAAPAKPAQPAEAPAEVPDEAPAEEAAEEPAADEAQAPAEDSAE